MSDPKDDVPLPSGGLKELAPIDDDEQNEDVPAETDPAPETPLDEIMGDDVDDENDVDDESAPSDQ